MDESSSQEPKKEDTAPSVDLSALKSFSFGTQWSEASKSPKPDQGKPRFGGKPGFRSDDRPDRRQGGQPPRKDRRPPRPASGPGGEGAAPAARFDRPREGAGAGGERRSEGFGGERREGGGGRQFSGRGRQQGGREGFGHNQPPRPYESPIFDVTFYPDDNCFSAIIKAMRANHLTYELFHVAKLFMEKSDRFIASVTRKAEAGQKPEKVFVCSVDNVPFATEEEAILHAVKNHTDAFFTVEEIEVEPPSGNFAYVNRCPFTKVLLGPPNYHKYEEALRNHHRTRLPNMPFEKLQAAVETVREPEVVAEWLEAQKKATRYTTKVAEGEQSFSFTSVDDVVGYLRTAAKSKVVKQVNYARVPGSVLENYKESEACKAMEGERQRQLRFPLDTANAIRGRMRREKFSIYKKGAKGVTYVCSTKRNFRAPGQVMAPDLDRIIRFLEAQPLTKAKEFGPKYQAWLAVDSPETPYDEKKVQRDLHWLIADGYISHFEDDALFAQPVLEAGGAHPDHDSGDDEHVERRPAQRPRKSAAPAAAVAEESAAETESEPSATPEPDAESESEATAATSEAEPEPEQKSEPSAAAEQSPAEPEAEPVATVESAETEAAAAEPESEVPVTVPESEAEETETAADELKRPIDPSA